MHPHDRIRETADFNATDPFALNGADSGYAAFGDVLADLDEVTYSAVFGTQWEVGQGRYETSGNQIVRLEVFSNSEQTTALISFSAGTGRVWIDHSAETEKRKYGLMIAISQGVGII
jgi:hypothetical protein